MLLGLISMLLGLIIAVSLHHANRKRSQRVPPYELTPNCLLTKHPILFLPGKQSLVYFNHYWNHIPQYLSDHGYQVSTPQLPWRSRKSRQRALANFLEEARRHNLRFHILADQSSASEIQALASQDSPAIATIHIVAESPLPPSIFSSRQPIESLTFAPSGANGHVKRFLARIHAHLTLSAKPYRFCAEEIGWTTPTNWLNVAKVYLNWAIGLAERDYRTEMSSR